MFPAQASELIGRVGALAIALGIGGLVAVTPWVASADDSASTTATSSTSATPRSGAREQTAAAAPANRVSRGRNVPAAAAAQRSTTNSSPAQPGGPVPEVSVAQAAASFTPPALPATAVATPVAVTPAVSTAAAASIAPATVPAVAARPTAAVASFVASAVTAPAGGSTGTPVGPLDFVTGALSLVSSEINRTSRRLRGALAAAGTATPAPAATTGPASATYSVASDWGSGFTGTVNLTAGPSALNGWTVSFTTPAEITNVWNGVITSHVGTAYVVTNAAWNGQVAAGASTSFGFQATTGAAGSAVTGLQLNGVASPTPTPTPTPTQPTAAIGNATLAEPASGTTPAAFTVTLSKASTTPVTIGYATANGTATAGADYTATTGTLSFAPGVTSQQISVPVLLDTIVEPSETFTVTLSNPSGATITTATATGTITNTVPTAVGTAPTISLADAVVTEGNSGTSNLAFTATLSKASATAVTVKYATSNGTATAGQDYTAGSGTITFAPGVTSQTVNVAVTGDTTVEPTETLTVTLSTPSGATIARAVATGTIVTDDFAAQTGGTTAQWGNAFFAPYVDMAGWPVPDLVAMSKATGASLFTLGFLQADANGKAAWGSYTVLEPTSTDAQAVAINKSIATFRAAGGDVMISFGGVAGTSLAQYYAAKGLSAQELANAYSGVIDTYGVTHLDFDIEGAAIADAAAIALNSSALKLLQQSRPSVQIWYTLPVLPQGLTSDGINVVQAALTAGVKLAGVNVMAMDYGEGPAPTSGTGAQTMGTYAIQSAQSTYTQLSSVYTKNGQTLSWNQIGVTPMIGVNDITSEVFTVADAQALDSFAVTKGLGMLGYWSVERDYPGTLGQPTHNASGVSSPAGSFSGAFNQYGTINVLSTNTTSPTPTPAPTGTVISAQYGTTVIGGKYVVQNNAWNNGSGQTITVTPTGFAITAESGSAPTNGAPLAYPSIYIGCHYGNCSPGAAPVQVSQIHTATSSISYTYASGIYDASYDIWLNPTPITTGVNKQEVMIWLNRQGSIQPVGSVVGSVAIGGQTWAVWQGSNGGNDVISYVAPSPISSADFNLLSFVSDVEGRSTVTNSWYLTSIQAGFEPWTGGVGLAVNSFTASIT